MPVGSADPGPKKPAPAASPWASGAGRPWLPPETFHLPVEEIRAGHYSDKYFVRTRQVLVAEGRHPRVLMQVFTRKDGILCGIEEAVAVLQLCSDPPGSRLVIHALRDRNVIMARETVMTIEGDYAAFAHLETVYLGVLARGTGVATMVRQAVHAAGGAPVLFFAARFSHYLTEQADGYAAVVGGAAGVSTDANGDWVAAAGMGTIPHGLIAGFAGDTVAASAAFDRHVEPEVQRIALVDFENNCPETAVAVARALDRRLWAVRLDTAEDLWDDSLTATERTPENRGVSAPLVRRVRSALDEAGFPKVKIVVSGGFNAERLRRFVAEGVPFDAVGIGSWFFREQAEFTADVVMVDGRYCAKVGRHYHPNPHLQVVPP
jgi:nicotinate phosphoribosyltransferase